MGLYEIMLFPYLQMLVLCEPIALGRTGSDFTAAVVVRVDLVNPRE